MSWIITVFKQQGKQGFCLTIMFEAVILVLNARIPAALIKIILTHSPGYRHFFTSLYVSSWWRRCSLASGYNTNRVSMYIQCKHIHISMRRWKQPHNATFTKRRTPNRGVGWDWVVVHTHDFHQGRSPCPMWNQTSPDFSETYPSRFCG